MVCDHLLSALMTSIVADKPGFVKENGVLFTIRLRFFPFRHEKEAVSTENVETASEDRISPDWFLPYDGGDDGASSDDAHPAHERSCPRASR